MVDGKVKRRFAQGPADSCRARKPLCSAHSFGVTLESLRDLLGNETTLYRTPTNHSQNTLTVTKGFFAHFLYAIILCNNYLTGLVKIPDKHLGQVV